MDNLAINDIFGFVTSFNSQNWCRICTTDKIETQSQVKENPHMLRTVENYRQHCKDYSTGIKAECIFNEIPNFHIIENATADIMHDVFEGICRYEIAKILNIFITKERFFSLEILNERLHHIDCGRNFSKNVPVSISNNALKTQYLIISASEMVFLIQHFGILIGDLVPVNHRAWEVFLTLREIISIVMSSAFTSATTELLETLISEHHSLYLEVFAESLKPKHQLLLRYPRLLKQLGPLKHLSSLRFEAKHKTFKDNAKVIMSRKNCPYTLALKHQLALCHRFLSGKRFSNRLSWGPTLNQRINDLEDYCNFKHVLPLDIQCKHVLDTWVKNNGIIYRKDIAIATHLDNNNIVFGKIRYIIIDNMDQILFIYVEFHTKDSDRHYCAYEVMETCVWKLIRLKDLFMYDPQNVIAMTNGNLYILFD